MNNLVVPDKITLCKNALSHHPLFSKLKTIEQLRLFMESHVYAVWDFMSLLKSLQREISCVDVPWRPSSYSKSSVRFINEIVLGEESDLDIDGQAIDHFSMYLEAMDEVGANTNPIREFIATLDLDLLPSHVKPFVSYNLELAVHAPVHQVAGAFFFGREDLIPSMFSGIIQELESAKLPCSRLNYYLKRHIDLDGDEHGPLAMSLLSELTHNDQKLLDESFEVGVESLRRRNDLWDSIALIING